MPNNDIDIIAQAVGKAWAARQVENPDKQAAEKRTEKQAISPQLVTRSLFSAINKARKGLITPARLDRFVEATSKWQPKALTRVRKIFTGLNEGPSLKPAVLLEAPTAPILPTSGHAIAQELHNSAKYVHLPEPIRQSYADVARRVGGAHTQSPVINTSNLASESGNAYDSSRHVLFGKNIWHAPALFHELGHAVDLPARLNKGQLAGLVDKRQNASVLASGSNLLSSVFRENSQHLGTWARPATRTMTDEIMAWRRGSQMYREYLSQLPAEQRAGMLSVSEFLKTRKTPLTGYRHSDLTKIHIPAARDELEGVYALRRHVLSQKRLGESYADTIARYRATVASRSTPPPANLMQRARTFLQQLLTGTTKTADHIDIIAQAVGKAWAKSAKTFYHGSTTPDLATLKSTQPNMGGAGVYGADNIDWAALYALAKDRKGMAVIGGANPKLLIHKDNALLPEGNVYEYDSDKYSPPPESDPNLGWAVPNDVTPTKTHKVQLADHMRNIEQFADKEALRKRFAELAGKAWAARQVENPDKQAAEKRTEKRADDKQTAVIIRGNPEFTANNPAAEKFYAKLLKQAVARWRMPDALLAFAKKQLSPALAPNNYKNMTRGEALENAMQQLGRTPTAQSFKAPLSKFFSGFNKKLTAEATPSAIPSVTAEEPAALFRKLRSAYPHPKPGAPYVHGTPHSSALATPHYGSSPFSNSFDGPTPLLAQYKPAAGQTYGPDYHLDSGLPGMRWADIPAKLRALKGATYETPITASNPFTGYGVGLPGGSNEFHALPNTPAWKNVFGGQHGLMRELMPAPNNQTTRTPEIIEHGTRNAQKWLQDMQKAADLLPEVQLQEHQQRIADRVSGLNPRMLVYHGLGSGKSLSALAAAEAAQKLDGGNYGIVAPASLTNNFQKEIKKFTTGSTPEVMSYTGLGMGKQFQDQPETLIMDEAARLRNPDSAMTRAAVQAAARAKRVMLLTGTPITNEPKDLASLISLLHGKQLSPEEFDKQYVGEETVRPNWSGWLQGAQPGVRPVMRNGPALRKLLEGHVDYQPSKTPEGVNVNEQTIRVPLSPEQDKIQKAIRTKVPPGFLWKIDHEFPMSRQELAKLNSFMTGFRQVGLSTQPFRADKSPLKAFQQSAKMQAAFKNLQETLKSDPRKKAIIYSNFVNAGLNPYSAGLTQAGIPHGIFTGSEPVKDRQAAVDAYNQNKLRALLIGPAGAEGISTKGTSLIQLMDPHWNEARSQQAQGRGLRFDSHTDLPEELKNVAVQRYLSSSEDPSYLGKLMGYKRERTGDEVLSRLTAEKERLNEQFRQILRDAGTKTSSATLSAMGYARAALLRKIINSVSRNKLQNLTAATGDRMAKFPALFNKPAVSVPAIKTSHTLTTELFMSLENMSIAEKCALATKQAAPLAGFPARKLVHGAQGAARKMRKVKAPPSLPETPAISKEMAERMSGTPWGARMNSGAEQAARRAERAAGIPPQRPPVDFEPYNPAVHGVDAAVVEAPMIMNKVAPRRIPSPALLAAGAAGLGAAGLGTAGYMASRDQPAPAPVDAPAPVADPSALEKMSIAEKCAFITGASLGALGGLATGSPGDRGHAAGRGAVIGGATELGMWPGALAGGVGGSMLGRYLSTSPVDRFRGGARGGAYGAIAGALLGGTLGNVAGRGLVTGSARKNKDKDKEEDNEEADKEASAVGSALHLLGQGLYNTPRSLKTLAAGGAGGYAVGHNAGQLSGIEQGKTDAAKTLTDLLTKKPEVTMKKAFMAKQAMPSWAHGGGLILPDSHPGRPAQAAAHQAYKDKMMSARANMPNSGQPAPRANMPNSGQPAQMAPRANVPGQRTQPLPANLITPLPKQRERMHPITAQKGPQQNQPPMILGGKLLGGVGQQMPQMPQSPLPAGTGRGGLMGGGMGDNPLAMSAAKSAHFMEFGHAIGNTVVR